MIADLASVPMADTGIPITNGIISILALLLLDVSISLVNLKSIKARSIICGTPSILINRGTINEKKLRKENFTINELQERLREKDVYSLEDVEYAILETSGQITVIQKPEKRCTIPEDFGIKPVYEEIPYDLIVDGKIMDKNLKKIGKDYKWLENEIKKYNVIPKEVLIATIDSKGKIFCQAKEVKK